MSRSTVHRAMPKRSRFICRQTLRRDAEVFGEQARDLGLEGYILPRPRRQARRIPPLCNTLMIGGWGDWQNAADLQRILLDWRSARFSRSNALSLSASLVGTPARMPLSTSDFSTHSSSV